MTENDDINTDWLAATEIVGGHPALDFVNTVHSRVESCARDYLQTPAHLFGWCTQRGLLGIADARQLARLEPARKTRLLGEARGLRETIYAVLQNHMLQKQDTDDLARFDRILRQLGRWRVLTADMGRFAWRYTITPSQPESLLAPIAFSAAALLTSPELRRVKACPPPEGCGWLFLDRSRNGSRTWCSMKTCGNAAKLRRYRARHAAGNNTM